MVATPLDRSSLAGLLAHSAQEADAAYANLDDENPAMVVRMLQAMYSSDYSDSVQEGVLPKALASNTLCSTSQYKGRPDIVSTGCTLHAQMYSLADKYDIRGLRRLAVAKFEICIRSGEATANDILAAGKVIYDSITVHDDELRKHIVYYAQTNMLEIHRLPLFQELMADGDFSWDFGTKYASRAHVYCPSCLCWSEISEDCSCGFNGLCRTSEACAGQDWSVLRCDKCKRQGQMFRDDMNDDKDLEVIGSRKLPQCEGLPRTPPATPKKRKLQ